MTIPPTESGSPPSVPEPELPAWAKRRTVNGQLPENELAAFIGAKWPETYRRKFLPFMEDASFVPTWNWSAALASPVWFLYRKLYLTFFGFFILPDFAFRWLSNSDVVLTPQNIQAPENQPIVWMYMAVRVSSMIAAGGTANWFLFRRARAASRLVALQRLPEPDATALLQRIGGVNRSGPLMLLALSVVLAFAQLKS